MADSSRRELRKVLFTYEPEEIISNAVRESLPDAEIVVATDDDERLREIVDTDLTMGGSLSADMLSVAEHLVWHHVPWVGVDGLDLSGISGRDMTLTNSSGVNAPNIAEHVVAMMLAFARNLPDFVRETDRGHWRGWIERPKNFELTDQTVVLLGTGSIGREIARRLRSFDMKIIGANRSGQPNDGLDEVVAFDALSEVLPDADHVVSSLPMTTATKAIVDVDFLDDMKDGAYFFNVGRGGTVDQDALADALVSGKLAGAGLDVVEPEPLPADSRLWNCPNILITGHTAGSSPLFPRRSAALIREQIRRWTAGEDLVNVVDLDNGY